MLSVEEKREKANVYMRAWRRRNPGKERPYIDRWIAENVEHVRAYKRAYYAKDPFPKIESQHRRRALLAGVGQIKVEREHLQWLLEAQDWKCLYCGVDLKPDKQIDHRIPLARGGVHAPHNLAWSCKRCNLRKKARTESEFREIYAKK